jgi:GH15 family glucan-1,4-alpha-glucosidase
MFFPSCEILRKIEVLRGEIPFLLHLAPKPHYAEHWHLPRDQGAMGISWLCGHDDLKFRGELNPQSYLWRDAPGGPELQAEFVLRHGEYRFFSLSYHQTAPATLPALGEEAQLRLFLTAEFWRSWAKLCCYQGPYFDAVQRSALALKLLAFAPSGAIVAAPTSSLPEELGGFRNWDYRYGWTRDAAFTVRALLRLGYHEEARAYLNWMIDTGAGIRNPYRIMYTVFGAKTPPERILDWFSGFRGSSPVRMGNAARDQFQLDIYGEMIDSILSFPQNGMEFDGETQRFLVGMGRRVCHEWEKPDDGIWEPRSEPLHHTHSKVMAWIALDRLVSYGERYKLRRMPVSEFKEVRSKIRDAIEHHGYDEELGTYTGVFDSRVMDAALLTLPLVGYCDPKGPRIKRTIDQVRRELARGELVYRYLSMDDGLPGREGCFGVCSFWLIDALARSGRRKEARKLFEQVLARSNSVGLWPEEIEPLSGEFLGNYPQAFTHIGLINSALTLMETQENAA